jgi:hypothetical protein
MSTENVKQEPIRAWYRRSTKVARNTIYIASLVSLIVMPAVWIITPLITLQRMQTFSGGVVIPIMGGIWIFAFIFMFLVPSREASFRAQESMEKMVGLIEETVSKKVDPAVVVWKNIGERVQSELDKGLLDDLKGAVKDLREAAAKIHEGNGEVKKFAADVKPVVKALQELHGKIEKGNVLVELVEGARAIRALGGPLPSTSSNGKAHVETEPVVENDGPKVKKALELIRKKT